MKKAVLILVLVCMITGCSVKKIEEQSDSEKFAIEYNISKNNPFRYTTYQEIKTLWSEGSGIIFLGDSDDEWSQKYVKILNKVLKQKQIKEVLYFNLQTFEEEHPKKYKNLKKQIKQVLKKEEELTIPAIFFLHDGKVVGYRLDLENLKEKTQEKDTDETKINVKKECIKLIDLYQKEVSKK